MEISRSLVDLETEDPCFFHQWSMNSFDELTAFGDEMFESFEETKQHQQLDQFSYKRPYDELTGISVDERSVKQMRTNSFSSCENGYQLAVSKNHFHPAPNSTNYFNNSNSNNQVGGLVKPKQEIIKPSNNNIGIINFPTEHHRVISQDGSSMDQNNNNYVFNTSQEAKRVSKPTAVRLPQAQDHILAERRRREKLSQRFIALSALVPGLKKMDKASVLEEAIKYLKHLQEKAKELEEQARNKSREPVVVVKRHELHADVNTSSSSEDTPSRFHFEESLPEIEARFSGKDVLIRVHCEKKEGVLKKIVSEIENLHLSVMNTSSMTFSSAIGIITLVARINDDFSMTMKEFMKNLRSALKKFIYHD